MLDVFVNVIVPVFLVALVAAGFQKWRKVAVGPVSQISLYVLTPALIFVYLVQQELPGYTSVRIVAATLLTTLIVMTTSFAVSIALRHDRTMRSAFMLATVFPNAGNLALPVLLLALGEDGLAIGVIVFVTQAILGQSLGVFVAASSQFDIRQSVRQIFKLPAIYAIFAALAVRALDLEIPFPIFEPIRMLSQASIPVMLVVLGFQLGGDFRLDSPFSLLSAVVVRLLASVPIAYVVATLFALDSLSVGAVVIVYAMPAAVFTIILSTEFKANPNFVTNAVVGSTISSAITLAVVISVVQNILSV